MGLREAKKEKTRLLISCVARDLFIERGFADVTVAEIARKSEVALATLFNYFPTKESIIFDREDEIDPEILAAVREREKGQSVLDALHTYFLSSKIFNPPSKKIYSEFMKLVRSSPELSAYFRAMLGRYQKSLAGEIKKQSSATKDEAECIAKLIIEGVIFACHSHAPKEALNLTFKILKTGWKK